MTSLVHCSLQSLDRPLPFTALAQNNWESGAVAVLASCLFHTNRSFEQGIAEFIPGNILTVGQSTILVYFYMLVQVGVPVFHPR